MSVLVFGNYTCEYNRVDKSAYITYDNTSYDVDILNTGTNEDNYIFTVDMTMDELRAFNYCKIDGKEYFIEPVRALNGGISEVKATVDVLHQNRAIIYDSDQLVERNAKKFNAYLNDPLKTYASYETVDCKVFSGNPDESLILITCG